MSEENVKRMFETIAQILSDREQVNITVTVTLKDDLAQASDKNTA